MVLKMKDKTIESKLQGITWTEVLDDLNKATRKLGSKNDKDTSESDSSSDKT